MQQFIICEKTKSHVKFSENKILTILPKERDREKKKMKRKGGRKRRQPFMTALHPIFNFSANYYILNHKQCLNDLCEHSLLNNYLGV